MYTSSYRSVKKRFKTQLKYLPDSPIVIIFKLMARTVCLVRLVITALGCCINDLGRGSTRNGHITKLDQTTFLKYLWTNSSPIKQSWYF